MREYGVSRVRRARRIRYSLYTLVKRACGMTKSSMSSILKIDSQENLASWKVRAWLRIIAAFDNSLTARFRAHAT